VESAHALVALSESQEEGSRSLFVTLARRAADGPGLAVTRTGERGLVQTKFGAVETLEATLVGGIGRVCTGFAAADPRPVRIEGWLCAPLGRPPEPQALACLLDRLTLAGPASADTAALFRVAESRRDPRCRAVTSDVRTRTKN